VVLEKKPHEGTAFRQGKVNSATVQPSAKAKRRKKLRKNRKKAERREKTFFQDWTKKEAMGDTSTGSSWRPNFIKSRQKKGTGYKEKAAKGGTLLNVLK